MSDKSASQQIDDIIKQHEGWKGGILAQVRAAIHAADPNIVEEIKWRMATRPEGLAVWSHNGIVCFAEIWKDNIKLLFPKGASLKGGHKLFNARLKSKDIRAIEFKDGDKVNSTAIKGVVLEAIELNKQ